MNMTREQMEVEVSKLLTEQRRLARLNLSLPPDESMLLTRLLYRLGWTKMKRRPKRYAEGPPTSEHDQFIGGIRDSSDPNELSGVHALADYMEENDIPGAIMA